MLKGPAVAEVSCLLPPFESLLMDVLYFFQISGITMSRDVFWFERWDSVTSIDFPFIEKLKKRK